MKRFPDTFYFDTSYLMRNTARAFVEASLREKNPDATVEAIRQGLFLRFYGHEFDALTRDKILAAIKQAACRDCSLPGASGKCHGF